MKVLETDRLLLRQWKEDDFQPMAEHYQDEDLARFIGGVCRPETTWRRLAMMIGHWALRGHGYWALEEKSSGAFAGAVGLWNSIEWPELELGYWLVRDVHGKGYATEAGKAALSSARRDLGLSTLVSFIHPDNQASIRVAERLGATYDETIPLLDFGDHLVYRYQLGAS